MPILTWRIIRNIGEKTPSGSERCKVARQANVIAVKMKKVYAMLFTAIFLKSSLFSKKEGRKNNIQSSNNDDNTLSPLPAMAIIPFPKRGKRLNLFPPIIAGTVSIIETIKITGTNNAEALEIAFIFEYAPNSIIKNKHR